mmetsp:Transcript_7350/g.13281  ORF Transcript_7350/g.13281 Transcript_7350/m.13281 type:complete len:109 (-) Transcript_7350:4327-4653(-)
MNIFMEFLGKNLSNVDEFREWLLWSSQVRLCICTLSHVSVGDGKVSKLIKVAPISGQDLKIPSCEWGISCKVFPKDNMSGFGDPGYWKSVHRICQSDPTGCISALNCR